MVVLILSIISYINEFMMKGGLPMVKNNNIQTPTATIKNVLYALLLTLWAIGCSVAASRLALHQYIKQYLNSLILSSFCHRRNILDKYIEVRIQTD